MDVHRELGCGFLEGVYQEALALEFKRAGIPFKREVPLQINYKGTPLTKVYVADFVCYDKIIVELKAVSQIADIHKSQVKKLSKGYWLQTWNLGKFWFHKFRNSTSMQ